MIGMDATTGKALSGKAYREQHVGRVLTTPTGTCTMRRDFGSDIFELIDQPINGATATLLRAASAVALRRWCTWLKLSRVTLSGSPADGTLTIGIDGTDTEQPAASSRLSLTIPIRRTGTSS